MTARRSPHRTLALLVLVVTVLLSGCGSLDRGTERPGYRIALSMSFAGNDWQTEARNLILATANGPALRDKVSRVDVFSSGSDAQAQISQIQQMIAKKYDAILVYPISSTALNNVIARGCKAGIKMFTYDSSVTEPCAHNVSFDQRQVGRVSAQYLADKIGNRGNVVMITGVAGTSVDNDRSGAAREVFAERGITVLDQCAGNWAQGPAGQCMSRFLSAFPTIDAVWAQAGGTALTSAFDAVGRRYVPMISESENSWRLALMDPEKIARGLVGGSYGSPPYQGPAALQMAVEALEGKDFPHFVNVGFDWRTQADLKMCTTGSLADLRGGCNTFPDHLVSPGFFADWWSPTWTPGIDLTTMLNAD